jgi:hypothetical protein
MGAYRWILIIATSAIAIWLTFLFYVWSNEFKERFFYSNDWVSLAVIFIFIFAIGGIFRWFVTEEIRIRKPKKK